MPNPWDLYPDAPIQQASREPNLYDVYRLPTPAAEENPPLATPGKPGTPVAPQTLERDVSARSNHIDRPTVNLRKQEIASGKPPIVSVTPDPQTGRLVDLKGNHTRQAAAQLGVPVQPAIATQFGTKQPLTPAEGAAFSVKEHLQPDNKGGKVSVDPNKMGDRPFVGRTTPQGAVTDEQRAQIRAQEDSRAASYPTPKQKSILAVENEKGERMVVSVRGTQVLGWTNRQARPMGTVGQLEDRGWRLTTASPEEVKLHTPQGQR
jgi:hypothetical protein